MAAVPNITSLSIDSDGSYVNVNFTSTGSITEKLYLERAITKGAYLSEYTQVAAQSRGTATKLKDWTSAPADITYRYRIKATNFDDSGAVYSNEMDITMVCEDYSSVAPMYSIFNDRKMLYATSRDGSMGRATVYHKFAGRRYPVSEKAIQRSETVKVEWFVEKYEDYLDYQDIMTQADFWYRDNSGRSFHASCERVDVKDSQILNGFTCSAELTKIDGGVLL